ncbi:MAG: metallophosphoesterase family protein [Candidatus Omnitrophica bacterium]|nr:metallophosphoesterase family protein [Candidatus Omnitrophota bacterium]MDD5236899.1 metallophosphoesterase family protein [Candidatus Omnitrophota bacterium]MDD5610010.1 metallophosphoesterase family protein [Candidatus Omnitrophota bacterium]
MRYGIFSDVHANIEALDAVTETYKTEGIDKYLCIGDIIGYAASPRECLARVFALAEGTVAGNHDFACAGLFNIDNLNPVAREAILWTAAQLGPGEKTRLKSLELTYQNEDLTLVHGSLSEPEQFYYLFEEGLARDSFAVQKTAVCFIGHTHIPATFVTDEHKNISYTRNNLIEIKPGNKYIINVGSVGQPRDGNPKACFCIYDTDKQSVSIKRAAYDIKKTQGKIIDAGLPGYLAERLSLGR